MANLNMSERSTDSDGEEYDTAEDESAQDSEGGRRERSRSRLNSPMGASGRERSASARHRRQSRQRRRQRHGRRQRQRNQRNDRARYDEAWYFPREDQDEATPDDATSREVLALNRDWIRSLENNEQNRGIRRAHISPLVQGNRNHTITWRDNDRTVTVPPDQNGAQVNMRSLPHNSEHNITNNIDQRQAAQLPNSSHPDVNFNLVQILQDRARADRSINRLAAAQVPVATAAPAANYTQLVMNSHSQEHAGQHQAVQSLDAWENRVRPRDSWLNISASETRRYPANNHSRHVIGHQYPEERVISGSLHTPTHYGSQAHTAQDVTTAMEEENRAASRARLNHNSREDNSEQTPIPATSISSDDVEQPYRPLLMDDSNHDIFSRYTAAFRRQEERNEWRQRRCQRRDRLERREMEERVYQRRRQAAVSVSMSSTSDGSLTFQQPPATNTAIPLPPPVPTHDWQAPIRQNNEWPDAPSHFIINPGVLQGSASERREETKDYDEDGDIDDDSSYSEVTELLLRSYQDPMEGNSRVSDFLRRITAQGRVVISRVRTRITKQYFRRGDFQIALADFRGLHPEHARQVPGVGFTGTISNMYRLTVKQNSNFGKPTLEIRPMNKRVRKKKLHICYKIRYFSQRGAKRSPPVRSRIPIVV